MAAFICQIGPLGTKNWRFVRNTIVAGFPPTSSVGPLNSDLLPGKSCDPLGASAGLDTSPEKLKELRIAWNLHTSPKPSVYSLFKRQLQKITWSSPKPCVSTKQEGLLPTTFHA